MSELKPEPRLSPSAVKPEPSAPGWPLPTCPRQPCRLTAAAEIGVATSRPSRKRSPSSRTLQRRTRPRPKRPRSKLPKVEAPKVEAPKVEAPKVDAGQPEAPRSRQGHDHVAGRARWRESRMRQRAKQRPASAGSRRWRPWWRWRRWRVRLGGALATAGLITGFGHTMGREAAASNNSALEASVARIDADIVALKASVEHTSKMGMSQFNKTSDRLDKVEKAQAEPAAKLAKLSEAVDKLRARSAAGCRRRAGRREGRHGIGHAVRRPQRHRRRAAPPKPEVAGCRRWKAGCCATSPMAAR